MNNNESRDMKVLVAGDYVPMYRLAPLVEAGAFEAVLGEARTLTEAADYSLVNLECPVVVHEAIPIAKSGTNLRCTSRGVEALAWAGFRCVTLANNHFLDYGPSAVSDTLDACKQLGINVVGGGMTLCDACRTLYCDVAGRRLGVVRLLRA